MRKYAVCIKELVTRSTNLTKVAIEPKHKGKKPGQRKRKQPEKTASVNWQKKKKRLKEIRQMTTKIKMSVCWKKKKNLCLASSYYLIIS